MSESEDSTQLNFLNLSLGVWNGYSLDSNVCNWPIISSSTTNKMNGLILPNINKQSDKSFDDQKLDNSLALPTWSQNISILRDSSKMSIWSADGLTSVSKPQNCFGPMWGNTNSENSTNDDMWDSSRDPVFHVPRVTTAPNSWKVDQSTCLMNSKKLPVSTDDSRNVTDAALGKIEPNYSKLSTECKVDVSTMFSDLSLSPGNAFTPRSDSPLSKPSVVPYLSDETSVTGNAFSAEQLCDRLINTNEGWGRRPIDQTTPWELPERSGDQVNRSGITTPTPGACATANSSGVARIPFASSPVESNVWTNEPPTGTGIWEMHYENAGGRSAMWQPVIQQPAYRESVTGDHLNSAMMSPLTTNSGSRPSLPMQLNRQQPPIRDWDENEKFSKNWNNGGSSFNPPDRNMWPLHPSSLSESETQLGHPNANRNGPIQRRTSASTSHNEGLWPTSGPIQPVTGRPVLGGARSNLLNTSNQTEDCGWCPPDTNSPSIVWDTLSLNSSSTVTAAPSWSNSSPNHANASLHPQLFNCGDDIRRLTSNNLNSNATQGSNDRLFVHPYSNTYRADMVKYLMNQGFKKEDAHTALIDCNMEPERALQELRERYNSTRSINNLTQNPTSDLFHNVGVIGHHTNPQSLMHATVNSQFVMPPPPLPVTSANILGNNHRLKQPLAPGATATAAVASSQLMSMLSHPNSQLIRHQLSQQVRSGLNLSLPNNQLISTSTAAIVAPTAVSSGTTSGGNGGSLLGQPPPPPLSGATALPSQIIPPTNSPPSLGALSNVNGIGQNKNNRIVAPFATNAFNQGNPKRSPRQMSIINSIFELQKKHQSIHQQLMLYRNTPALCSQPQYADVFAELQGQMQKIESQLHAKYAQLNAARVQELMTQTVSNHSNTSVATSNNTIRGPHLSATDSVDGSFPSIGTWMAPQTVVGTVNSESFDKSHVDSMGPKVVNGLRNLNVKGAISNNWSANGPPSTGNAPTSNSRVVAPSHFPHWQASIVNQTRNLIAENSGKNHSVGSLSNHNSGDMQGSGQWLLVQSTMMSNSNAQSIHNLQSLLSASYRLSSFHVLNPTLGRLLICVQSVEDALQLQHNLGDQLVLEPISEADARVHLQQRCLNAFTDNPMSNNNQVNPSSELHSLSTSWNNSSSGINCNNNNNNNGDQFYPTGKKSNSHISRSGITVCGNK